MQDAGNHRWMRDWPIQWLRNLGNFNAIIIQDNAAPPLRSTSFVFNRVIVHVINFLLKSRTSWDILVFCWQTWAFYRNAYFSLNRKSWWNYRAYSPCPKMQTYRPITYARVLMMIMYIPVLACPIFIIFNVCLPMKITKCKLWRQWQHRVTVVVNYGDIIDINVWWNNWLLNRSCIIAKQNWEVVNNRHHKLWRFLETFSHISWMRLSIRK